MDDARTLAAAYIDRLEQRDWDGFTELLAEDVVYEMPQSRERIRGRARFLRFNVEYPGEWHLTPAVVLGDDRNACILLDWTHDGDAGQAIAFFEVAGGRITKVTDFWPEPSEPLPGREHLTERF